MMPDTGHGWAIVKRAGVAIAEYAAAWLATALIFLIATGSGIEAQTNEALPYYAAFAVCYGAAVGWWWIVAFPLLHFYAAEPIWNAIRYDGPVHYAYDRPSFVLVGTLAIVAGLAARRLYERTRAPDSSPQR
jgi:hypothetical protein